MPKFDELYPDARLGDDFQAEGVGVVWKCQYGSGSCVVCREPTLWIELCTESSMCSTECSKRFWDEWNETIRRADERSNEWTSDEPLRF